ncbi:MAG: hypothetical protein H6581_24060 [Bacteroidia bacterium]|nr:hypothetical protein [Bacteroidia bacterium]
MKRILVLCGIFWAMLSVQGFGQANLVSGSFFADGSGNYPGVTYEHAFNHHFAVGGDLGYSWTRNIFHSWWTSDTQFYYQFKIKPFAKYYFLFHKRYPGEGLYVQISGETNLVKYYNPISPYSWGLFTRGAGLGPGVNYCVWKGLFLGGGVSIRYFWLNLYTIESGQLKTPIVRKNDWEGTMWLQAGWNFGWNKSVRE